MTAFIVCSAPAFLLINPFPLFVELACPGVKKATKENLVAFVKSGGRWETRTLDLIRVKDAF